MSYTSGGSCVRSDVSLLLVVTEALLASGPLAVMVVVIAGVVVWCGQ